MGPSLYNALKLARSLNDTAGANGTSGGGASSGGGRAGAGSFFSLSQISCIASNCFEALAHMHSIQLTHTDLKPENVLFLQPFEKGSALPASPKVCPPTRHYWLLSRARKLTSAVWPFRPTAPPDRSACLLRWRSLILEARRGRTSTTRRSFARGSTGLPR